MSSWKNLAQGSSEYLWNTGTITVYQTPNSLNPADLFLHVIRLAWYFSAASQFSAPTFYTAVGKANRTSKIKRRRTYKRTASTALHAASSMALK